MAYKTPPKLCAEGGCEASYVPHYWGTVKAEGWFHQRDGKSYCPAHHPEWVAEWRAWKKRKK